MTKIPLHIAFQLVGAGHYDSTVETSSPLSLTKKTTEHAMGERKLKFVVDVEDGVQRISIQEHSVTYTKMAVNAFRTSERAQTAVGVSTVVIHTDINQDLKCRPQRVTLFLEDGS